jgi:Holliday junction resolvase
MRVGQARRRDFNEAAIVAALRAIGVDVWPISGAVVPDLLAFSRGTWLPIEVKRAEGTLTPAQLETYTLTKFSIVRTVQEALALFGVRS